MLAAAIDSDPRPYGVSGLSSCFANPLTALFAYIGIAACGVLLLIFFHWLDEHLPLGRKEFYETYLVLKLPAFVGGPILLTLGALVALGRCSILRRGG